MKWDIPTIKEYTNKAIKLKKTLRETWPMLSDEDIDNLVLLGVFQDAFRLGAESVKP